MSKTSAFCFADSWAFRAPEKVFPHLPYIVFALRPCRSHIVIMQRLGPCISVPATLHSQLLCHRGGLCIVQFVGPSSKHPVFIVNICIYTMLFARHCNHTHQHLRVPRHHGELKDFELKVLRKNTSNTTCEACTLCSRPCTES